MATKDLKLNTKNRNAAIKDEDIKYGPLNIDEPADYWEKVAEHWDTSVEAAKKSKCSNCIAFDISPRMKDCMPIEDVKGGLGIVGCMISNAMKIGLAIHGPKAVRLLKMRSPKKNQMKRVKTVTWQDILKKKPFKGYNKKVHSRKGGLSAKGRAHFKRTEGSNPKAPCYY